MAQYKCDPQLIQSFTAAEELEAYKLVIVDPTTDTSCRYPEADADTQLLGVTLNHAESGDQVDVAMGGIVLLTVDGAAANIAIGDWIMAHDTAGYGRKAGTTADTNYEVIGKALQAATADGVRIPVLISHFVLATEAS